MCIIGSGREHVGLVAFCAPTWREYWHPWPNHMLTLLKDATMPKTPYMRQTQLGHNKLTSYIVLNYTWQCGEENFKN